MRRKRRTTTHNNRQHRPHQRLRHPLHKCDVLVILFRTITTHDRFCCLYCRRRATRSCSTTTTGRPTVTLSTVHELFFIIINVSSNRSTLLSSRSSVVNRNNAIAIRSDVSELEQRKGSRIAKGTYVTLHAARSTSTLTR